MVGIELGRAHCRRRVTSLTVSVARWVHDSAMATFSEAPLSLPFHLSIRSLCLYRGVLTSVAGVWRLGQAHSDQFDFARQVLLSCEVRIIRLLHLIPITASLRHCRLFWSIRG